MAKRRAFSILSPSIPFPIQMSETKAPLAMTVPPKANTSKSESQKSASARDQVMLEFQRASLQMTRSFLESQERVMLAYLSGAPVFSNNGSFSDAGNTLNAYTNPAALTQSSNGRSDLSTGSVQYAEEITQQATSARSPEEQYPNSNSIHSERTASTESSNEGTTTLANESAAVSSTSQSAEQLITSLIEIVSERTGYPPEMLDPTLDLEADLGIDSIKRIEILNTFRKLLPEAKQESLEDGIEKLAGVKSLQGIMDWIKEEMGSESSQASGMKTNSDPTVEETKQSGNGNSNGAGQYSSSLQSSSSQTEYGESLPKMHTPKGARLSAGTYELLANGQAQFTITMDKKNDLFLNDHLFDGVPVMPMAMALELMTEAAHSLYPKCSVNSISKMEIPAGIVFDSVKDIYVNVQLQEATAQKVKMNVSVQTGEKFKRAHFKATLELTTNIVLASPSSEIPLSYKIPSFSMPVSAVPSASEIYERIMFHGRLFQGITNVSAMGANGIAGDITPTKLNELVAKPGDNAWVVNPILLDSSMQLAGVWARHFMDLTVLPAGFESLHLLSAIEGEKFHAIVAVPPDTRGMEILCDLGVYSEDGKLLLFIKGLKGIGSKSLNRLASKQSETVA